MFKLLVKLLIPLFVVLYKISGGLIGGKMGGLPVLLLSSTGRKTGKQRTIPITYMREGDAYVVIASFAGQPRNPAWYHNLKHNPQATIQIGRSQIAVQAEIADAETKQKLWAKALHIAPVYQEAAKRTSRDIPIVVLHPIA